MIHSDQSILTLESLLENYELNLNDSSNIERLRKSEVIQAFGEALEALKYVRERRRKKESAPSRAGLSWNGEEDTKLIERFADGLSIKDLAAIHERTKGSVVSRLVKLGKLDSSTKGNREPVGAQV